MSLKPKHSEGPWTYAPWANEDGRWCVSQCGTEAVAIAVTFGQPNAEVDARLMAKAPQLLSSARAALADLERALDKLGAMGHGMDWDSVHELRQVLSLIDDAPRKGTEEAEAPDWRRKPAYSQETVRAVSDGFADKIRKALTAEEWADLCRLNAKESSPEVCHSHDFLDSNIFMCEAIEEFAPDVPFWDPEGGGTTDVATALWNDAWDLAKREHMTLSPGPGRSIEQENEPGAGPRP